MFSETSQRYAKHHFERAIVENVRSLSCWLHSPHTVLNGRKSFVVTSCEETSYGSYVQLSTINTTIPVCVVTDCAPSPPAGSAMSGLDGLIGAEERVINSKPKISDNVVRALCHFIVPFVPQSFSNLLNT